ncbi:MAG: hypothetical protein J5J00_17280 [Deltaproteobacteria bacterium]|nr:hypothetical protein [Deltaproteobacteria bacterium]
MASPINSLSANHSSDLSIARDLGRELERANKKFRDAVSSGDEARINTAKLDLDKAQENLMGYMTAKDKEHDLIMQLIQMLRD